MNKAMNFLKKHIVKIIFVILLILPFFWYKIGTIDLGGDSSRFYLRDAMPWFQSIAPYGVNPLSSLETQNINYFMIPFFSLLILIQNIFFHNYYIVNSLVSGLILSGGFIFLYLIIKEIIIEDEGKQQSKSKEITAMIGGLFFAFSPFVYSYERPKGLIHIYTIVIYPLVFLFLIKFIKSGKYINLIYGALISLLFAVLFATPAIPWTVAFFSFSLLFLFIYSCILKKKMLFLKGFFFFGALFFSLHLFHIIPTAIDVLTGASDTSSLIFDKAGKIDRGLNYFNSVYKYVEPLHTFASQSQIEIARNFDHPLRYEIENFGIKTEFLFMIYMIVIILAGILIKNSKDNYYKKLYFGLLSLFLILMFLETANINPFTVGIYSRLFDVPGFAMFRSFYTKFNIVFIFFYTLLFSVCLYYIVQNYKSRYNKLYYAIIIALILLNGFPLLSGRVVNTIIRKSKGIQIPIKIPQDYIDFIKEVQNDELSTKFMSFPLTNEEYQVFGGENGGAYFGPSSISRVGGKNDFNGIGSFKTLGEEVQKLLSLGDADKIKTIISHIGIGYIVHNNDDFIYDNFPDYPYGGFLKKIFPDQKKVKEFIDKLNLKKIKSFGSFDIYSNESVYPKVYIPQRTIATNFSPDDIFSILSNYKNQTTAYFTKTKSVNIPNEIYQNSDIYIKIFDESDDITGSLEKSEIGKSFDMNENIVSKDFDIMKSINTSSKISIKYFSGSKMLLISTIPENTLKVNGQTINDSSYDIAQEYLSGNIIIKIGNKYITVGDKDMDMETEIGDKISLIKESGNKNLIPNSSFETGFWQEGVKDCSTTNPGMPTISMKQSTDATDGKKAMELNSQNHFACTNTMITGNFNNGEIYKLSFDYKIIKGEKANAYYKFFNEVNSQFNSFEITGTQNKWNHFETYITPDFDFYNFEIFLYAQSDGSFESDVIYDNILLRPLEKIKDIENNGLDIQGQKGIKLGLQNNIVLSKNQTLTNISDRNIIGNGSFEDGFWNEKIKDCSAANPGAPIIYMDKSSDATNGNISLQLSSQNHFACTNTRIDSNFAKDKIYKFSLDYKIIKGEKANAYIKLANTFKSVQNSFELTGENEKWNHFETYITADSDYNYAEIFLYAQSMNNEEVTVRYDNVSLEQLLGSDVFDYYLRYQSNKTDSNPNLEFKEINPTKYKIIIKKATNPFPLVVNNYFNKSRKVYLKNNSSEKGNNDLAQNYETAQAMRDTADKDEIKNYASQGLITNIGGKNKLGFVSKQNYGSIQNDNLSNGNLLETFFAGNINSDGTATKSSINPNTFEIKDIPRGTANNFFNAWRIDPQKLCQNNAVCKQNEDGSYDIEIVLETKNQQYFYICAFISILALIGSLSYIFIYYRKKNEKI